ncbi:hypothetical protein COCMIDRAFT_105530 [Bipolaris oryzae ATCC 44560]|uniref:Uncharacterized protein n=1 Tax=Bipolaris oryzae ATCC 44560 TaxID=930090 RepID=W6ZDU4_COCMI|nr:uncharacterized protein COCMIDRAFT_105530 [Bipolaris oryzae ATCC 44560]EUC41671.1 hypothetical protein COCMIDRAFT_105530 [Bipolaris oryzae ATCC 44560]
MQPTGEFRSYELGEASETARAEESSGFFLNVEMQDSVAESNGAAAWGQERRETVMGEQQRLDGLGNGGDQDNANSLDGAAIELEPRRSTNDLERMDVNDGGIHSSTLPNVTAPEKEPVQGPIEKMQLGFEGHGHAKYSGFVEDKHGQGHPSLTSIKAIDSRRHEETANPGFKDQTTMDMDELQGYQTHSFDFIPLEYSTPDISTLFEPFSTPASYNPRFQSYPQQQPFTQLNEFSFDPNFDRQQQLQVQVDNKKRQLENAKRMYEQYPHQGQQANSDFSFSQNQADVPASILTGPLSYQRAPQSTYQTLPFGNSSTNYQSQGQSEFSYGQTASKQSPASYSAQSHNSSSQATKFHSQPQGVQTTPEAPEEDTREEPSSDDDEPLRTRLARHPSAAPSPHAPSPINWKLPSYDIHFSPSPPPKLSTASSSRAKPTKDPSLPIAKISLPGLIREPLVLSPDHAAQELALLTNIFLPGQQALSTPDPEPALAVLNFHSIAMMVVEAYVQYEIGDEMGQSGPSSFPNHSASSSSSSSSDDDDDEAKAKGKAKAKKEEKEYMRIRCARTANVDDIFFAVIDRWRAGLESNKKSFKLIRGIQEFVDVALDVIFWIKEHGLLLDEEGGAKAKAKANDDVKKEEGISVLTARKKTAPKAKVEKPKPKPKKNEATPKKKRRVPVTPGVTVVRKK